MLCKIVFAKPIEVMNVGKRSDVVDITSHKRYPRYAREIKRKQQMIDLIKQQALSRASLFRYETARHELEHILSAADNAVEVNTTKTGTNTHQDGSPCKLNGKSGKYKNGVCII